MCSRFLVSASTDQSPPFSSSGGSAQIWFTPNAAITFRMSSLSPCCVPSLRLNFLGGVCVYGFSAGSPTFDSKAVDKGVIADDKAHAAEFKTKFLRFMRDSVQAARTTSGRTDRVSDQSHQ